MKTRVKQAAATAVFAAATLLLAAAQQGRAQDPAHPEPVTTTEGVQAVLDAYVEALGGRAALDKLKAREAEGVIEIPHREDSGRFFTAWAAPDHGRFEIWATPSPVLGVSGFDGRSGWREGAKAMGSYERLNKWEIEDVLRVADPVRYANLKDLYPGVVREVGGDQAAAGVAVLRVVTDGAVIRYLFDDKTHLLKEIEEQLKDESVPRHYEFKKYWKVDGIKFPYLLHEIVPFPNLDPAAARIERTVRFRRVTHSKKIDARFFKPDPGWKAVLKLPDEAEEAGGFHAPEFSAPPLSLDEAVSSVPDPLPPALALPVAALPAPAPPTPTFRAQVTPAVAAADDGAQAVLDAYVEALGGRAALDRLRTRRSQAIIEDLNNPVSRSVVISWETPNHGSIELFEAGQAPQVSSTDGTLGWNQRARSLDQSRGQFYKIGTEPIRDVLRLADPLRYANLKSLYPDVTRETSTRRKGAPLVLRAQAGGVEVRFLFDAQSHLLTELVEVIPGRDEPRRFEFEDYREIDGILFPYAIHETFTVPGAPARIANQDKVIRFQKVQHNVEIPGQLFTPPAALLSEPDLDGPF